MPGAYESHRTYSLAASLISKWEGFRRDVYFDSVGVRTVGYGFTSSLPYWNAILGAVPLTREQADRFLILALEDEFLPALSQMTSPDAVDAPHKAAALTSWMYNVGKGAASSSTLIQLLNKGKEEEAEVELLKWVYAGGEVVSGLVSRREAERRMMERDEMGRAIPTTFNTDPESVPVAGIETLPEETGIESLDLDLPGYLSGPLSSR